MAYPLYLRQRACELRTERHLSLIEIADRLSLPKTTVYYWIKDLPLGRARRTTRGQRIGNRGMQANYLRRRQDAYAQGRVEYVELIKRPTFRDFVVLYIAEGHKRDRNSASICNSDPSIVAMSAGWLRALSTKRLIVRVQYHADQDEAKLRHFWSETLAVEPAAVALTLKTNSGNLRRRSWRCVHGVASVGVYDTLFRARLQAWMDLVKLDWHLDSALPAGRGAIW